MRGCIPVLTLMLAAAPAAAQLDSTEVAHLERPRVVAAAERYLREAPVTITAFPAPRSAGGAHDFYSEGDYWWRSEEHTSELQSQSNLVCRLLLEKKK